MEVECHPIATVPGTTPLLRAFLDPMAARGQADAALLRRWYPAEPFGSSWAYHAPELSADHRQRLATLLMQEAARFGAGQRTRENIERLSDGAAAVVTGQQVGLFGGPLLTLLKAATAIRKAQDATARTGRAHVPVFWLASEDHDLAEVNQISLPTRTELDTLKLGLDSARPFPVGNLALDGNSEAGRTMLEAVVDRASELIAWGPVADLLRDCYLAEPGATFAQAFGRLLTSVFAEFGLIVMDASSRGFHELGSGVLRAAIENAQALEAALIGRSEELTSSGYHAQVLVSRGHSLLFLLDAETGARQALRRVESGAWKAGGSTYSSADLIGILETAPERLSPNALLRPVFQDAILPTAAYIGGPAEIAYFAQSAVVYQQILGRVTPILPRLSATLVDPALSKVMSAHQLDLPQVWEAKNADALAQQLGARAIPIELKRKLSAAGNALDAELVSLTEYMSAMSAELGRAAGVSASKMRYQMNRLRRIAAAFELQREASLRKHANTIMLNLFPDGHLQERVIGGIWFLARYGDRLPQLLVDNAGQECPGHRILFL